MEEHEQRETSGERERSSDVEKGADLTSAEGEAKEAEPGKADDTREERPDGQAVPSDAEEVADLTSAEGVAEEAEPVKAGDAQEEQPGDQVLLSEVGKGDNPGLAEAKPVNPGVGRIDRFQLDLPDEPASSSLIDRMGQGLIRLMGRIPLINRMSPDRWNPRAVTVVMLALVIVLAASITASAFSVVSRADVPPAGKAAQDGQEELPEKPPEPAMFILQHEEKKWEIDLLSIGYDGKDIATVDQEKLKEWLEKVKEEVDEPAKDARMERWGAPIQPAEEGHRMDLKEIEENWLPHLSDYINKPQEIPLIVEKPLVTEEDLRAVNQRRIGQYTTYFDAGNVNRTTNIRLSAQAINNLVLNPGDSFSFNRVVGPRTAQRGYKPAPVIVRGEYSEGIGGGICQTSSTLYNSVTAAGLRVTLRYSHSKEVTYVPAGRDATVSWGGPDFRFVNSIDKPILIKAHVGNGFITISIYTTPDAKVTPRYVPPAPRSKPKQVEVNPDKPSNGKPSNGSAPGGDSGGLPGSDDDFPGDDDDGNQGGDDGSGDDDSGDGGWDEGDDGGPGTLFP